ncbi:MAG: methyltransferase domain-containing protein, partial [Acetobacteraceae bacterium]|nr:methyltransferase domain-containing protein [Acetobacteraceae bacterium]
DASFDHVFVCFVLEHMPDPETALAELQRVLKLGGSRTVIEGDHGSALFIRTVLRLMGSFSAWWRYSARQAGTP